MRRDGSLSPGLKTWTGHQYRVRFGFRVVSFLRYLFAVLEVLDCQRSADDLVADTPQGEPFGVTGMSKEMIISSSAHETRVAILEDDQVAEIFIERERSARSGWQRLQGTGLEGAAGHAVGVR